MHVRRCDSAGEENRAIQREDEERRRRNGGKSNQMCVCVHACVFVCVHVIVY